MLAVTPLTSTDEIHARCPGGALIRFELPRGISAAAHPGMWAAGDAVAYLTGPAAEHPALVGYGPAEQFAALVVELLRQLPRRPSRCTMPRDAHRALEAAGIEFDQLDHWDFRWTDAPPPPVAGEDDVAELTDDAEIAAFLAAHSPRHSLRPGAPRITRWAGIRDSSGTIIACGAQRRTSYTGIPHLASIATDNRQRGRGLGAAVTAWLTRRAIEQSGICTLGQYADNAAATRLYDKLGYSSDDHHTSGSFAVPA